MSASYENSKSSIIIAIRNYTTIELYRMTVFSTNGYTTICSPNGTKMTMHVL